MGLFSINIKEIVDLGTQVATSSALKSVDVPADELFEYIISIIILIYELNP